MYRRHSVSRKSVNHKWLICKPLVEVMSERQVISYDPSVTSMVLMVQNGRKCITYINYILKQLLTYVEVDMECY